VSRPAAPDAIMRRPRRPPAGPPRMKRLPKLAVACCLAASCSREPALPPVFSETATFDFERRFSEATVTRKNEARAPEASVLFVGTKKAQLKEGGNRPAIVLPPPAEVGYRVAVPDADCALRFALGLGFDKDARPAHVAYEVRIDGTTVFSDRLEQTMNAAGTDWAVDWKETELDLARYRGRDVTVTFSTELLRQEPAPDGKAAAPVSAGFAIARVVSRVPYPRKAAKPGRKNVLLVLVDTTRADHLSCYGYPRPTSPTVDALAREGVLYERAISQASWTWPATASVLTARYPHAHGILGPDRCYLDESIETLPELLQKEGYTTYGISANALICRAQNFNQGFETFVEAFRWPADRVAGDFLSWLDRNEGHAFFAYLHFMDPHHPYTPPEAVRRVVAPEMFDGEDDLAALLRIKEGQTNMRTVQKLRADKDHIVALYDAEIRHFDDELGRILDALRAKKLFDDTIVVVTSDHGEEFWEHGHIGHAKTLYQELIRVPLVVRAPGLAAPARENALVETIDVYPTLCEALKIAPPSDVQGQRLPGLSGIAPPVRPRPEAYSTTELSWGAGKDAVMELRSQEALVGPKMKLIRRQERPGSRAREDLLFDLDADPGETNDLAATMAAAILPLARKLEQWVAENSRLAPQNEAASFAASNREMLRRLGYIGGDDDDAGNRDDESENEGEPGPPPEAPPKNGSPR